MTPEPTHKGRGSRPIIANIARLHALMDRERLAALVLRGGQNIAYLAGIAYHGTLSRHLDLAASPRGVVLIWPRHAAPLLVVDVTAAGASERHSWIEELEVYNGYQEALFERVAKTLGTLGLSRERVGLDKNFIGAGYWESLAKAHPQMTMVDCNGLMEETRWIKTSAEVEMFRKGAKLLDDVFLEVLPTIRPGERETEVHGRIIGGCLARGAEFAHGIFNSHRNPVIYCGESSFVLEKGDIIRTDYLSYLDGYPGHQSRNAVLGKPSSKQQKDYADYYSIYRDTIDKLRPGQIAGDIYEQVVMAFDRIGWSYKVGLVGHSVGPWWHQQDPILCRGSRTPILAGMVLAMEPFVDHWHTQDMVLIKGTGAELLSADFDTSKLFVIDA